MYLFVFRMCRISSVHIDPKSGGAAHVKVFHRRIKTISSGLFSHG